MPARLHEGIPSQEGGCNFCHLPNHHNVVLVVDSDDEHCNVQVRFCLPCFMGAIQQIPDPKKYVLAS